MIAAIPSPSSGIITVGPLHIHLYGLTLLVAILACVWLTTRRWRATGGEPDLVVRVAVWGVAFGVVGARAYHDITSWSEVPTPKWKGVFEIWQGGLGVWGGILLGTLAAWVVVRRAGQAFAPFMDAAAPGMLLAQGIGRVGNWWNQELFGKPTSLPWGLKISVEHTLNLPVQYQGRGTYQPTFLYELLWDVAGVLLLLWLAKRREIRAPGLFCLYVAYYCFGRFFEELLRIDPAHVYFGLRLNAYVSIVVFVVAVVAFWRIQRRGGGGGSGGLSLRRRRPPVAPAGPKMAIPRGRVR